MKNLKLSWNNFIKESERTVVFDFVYKKGKVKKDGRVIPFNYKNKQINKEIKHKNKKLRKFKKEFIKQLNN